MSNLHRMVLQPTTDQHGPKFLNPNKTISKKAQSRASSAASSRAGSRATSRVNSAQVSRQGSEDEYETDDAATVIRFVHILFTLWIPGWVQLGSELTLWLG